MDIIKKINLALKRLEKKGYKHHKSYKRLELKKELIRKGYPFKLIEIKKDFLKNLEI